MPLHLLGKKSWNVYNADNIARVQRDEAAAAAAELAAEQRMQDADAARRLAILRGDTPPPLPQADVDDDPADNKQSHKRASGGFAPRKRKRAGEDDTDFEMRVAREQAEVGARVAGELGSGTAGGGSKRQKQKEEDVNIVDKRGHINLVGPPHDAVGGGKNAEYEREAAQKKREAEFGITMRFADAAGRDGLAAGQPWYVDGRSQQPARAADTSVATREDKGADIGTEPPMKNVWGKDDPKRRGRDTSRMNANDPLAAMRAGAKKTVGKTGRCQDRIVQSALSEGMMGPSDTSAGIAMVTERNAGIEGRRMSVTETGRIIDTMGGRRKDLARGEMPLGHIETRTTPAGHVRKRMSAIARVEIWMTAIITVKSAVTFANKG
ncbi:hypothetical protein Daus18300_000321 [Diaporthe australafricana]|uniref:CBF1-interacting co-repressor CIR N-terminal domain-containing protein n=1 Tax=Diaporthe australafricana TaxID=127596 RepID=A0ABR3Y5E3_9PEZI